MLNIHFPAIERVLGVRLKDLKFEHLQQMAARFQTDPVMEDSDLEFKEKPYDENEKNRRELPADVASMANGQGGIILLGIKAENGNAKEAIELEFTEQEEQRMINMVRSAVYPLPQFDIRRIGKSNNPNKGCYAILVPKSPNAPHAVRIEENYRYYRRDGSHKRVLAESEIANMYRSRFAGEAEQSQRLQRVFEEGVANLDRSRVDEAHLALTLVPNSPGSMQIDQRLVADGAYKWLDAYRRSGYFIGEPPRFKIISTGLRRLRVTNLQNPQTKLLYQGAAELHTDGSGFSADTLMSDTPGQPIVKLWTSYVIQKAIWHLRFLIEHAVENCGTHGDAAVMVGLIAPNFAFSQLQLVKDRYMTAPFDNKEIVKPPPPTTFMVNIDSLIRDPVETLKTGRMILTDIFQACGIPDVHQISPRGAIRKNHWGQDLGEIMDWARRNNVPVVADNQD